jgi:hypothetical protein
LTNTPEVFVLATLCNRHVSADLNQGPGGAQYSDSPWSTEYLPFRTHRRGSPGLFWLICFSLCTGQASSATDVVTYHNDIARTGQNLQETILTTGNLNSSSFGKLFTFPVDGIIDAEPLYLSAVSIPGKGTHNVVYAVTENDSGYAFDADTGSPLWQVSVLGSGESPSDDHGCSQISPQIGITSTPVIDRTTGPHGTIYVVAMSKNSSNYFQRIHALDMTTGGGRIWGARCGQGEVPGHWRQQPPGLRHL